MKTAENKLIFLIFREKQVLFYLQQTVVLHIYYTIK